MYVCFNKNFIFKRFALVIIIMRLVKESCQKPKHLGWIISYMYFLRPFPNMCRVQNKDTSRSPNNIYLNM